MKNEILQIRVSTEDRKLFDKAAKQYHKETGAKANISAAVRHVMKQYTGKE